MRRLPRPRIKNALLRWFVTFFLCVTISFLMTCALGLLVSYLDPAPPYDLFGILFMGGICYVVLLGAGAFIGLWSWVGVLVIHLISNWLFNP
jgi:hypothetical protein